MYIQDRMREPRVSICWIDIDLYVMYASKFQPTETTLSISVSTVVLHTYDNVVFYHVIVSARI